MNLRLKQGSQMAYSLKIIRANGTVEDLGIIGYDSTDPRRVRAFERERKKGIVPLARFFHPKLSQPNQI